MARPFKQGLQYFPLDVNIFDDDKLQDLNQTYGYLGEIVYIRLLTMVYSNGYYLEKSIVSIARAIVKSYEVSKLYSQDVESIIRFCGEIGLIDHELMLSGVITSRSIQKQFILSTKRRRRIETEKYWLLSIETMEILKNNNVDNNHVNVSNNPQFLEDNEVNVDNNRVNVDISTQRKVKLDKIDKELDKSATSAPVIHYLTKCLIEAKYINEFSLDLGQYDELFAILVDKYGFDSVRTVTRYICSHVKNRNEIDDRFDYFKVSVSNNLEKYVHRKENSNETFEAWFKRTLLQVDR